MFWRFWAVLGARPGLPMCILTDGPRCFVKVAPATESIRGRDARKLSKNQTFRNSAHFSRKTSFSTDLETLTDRSGSKNAAERSRNQLCRPHLRPIREENAKCKVVKQAWALAAHRVSTVFPSFHQVCRLAAHRVSTVFPSFRTPRY